MTELDEMDGSIGGSIKAIGIGGIGLSTIEWIRGDDAGVRTIGLDVELSRLGPSSADLRLAIEMDDDDDDIDDDAAAEALRRESDGCGLMFIAADGTDGRMIDIAAFAARAAASSHLTTVVLLAWRKISEDDDDGEERGEKLMRLKGAADAIIYIPSTGEIGAAQCAATIVSSVARSIYAPGLSALTVSEVAGALHGAGGSVVGIGEASGSLSLSGAVSEAMSSGTLDRELKGATNVIMFATTGHDASKVEMDHAGATLADGLDDDVTHVLCGHSFEASMAGRARAVLIASRFDDMKDRRAEMRSQVMGYLERVGYRYDDSTPDALRFGIFLDCKLSRTDVSMRFSDDGYMTICRVPILAVAEYRDEVMRYLTMVNFNLRVGNFDLDLDDGEIAFRTFTCYDGMVILSDAVISQSFGLGLSVLDDYGDGLVDVMMGYKDAASAFADYQQRR